MKKLSAVTAILLCAVFCMFSFASCKKGDETKEPETNVFTGNLSMTVKAVKEKFDFDDTQFITSEEKYAMDQLIDLYGIEDADLIQNIKNFVITYPSANSSKTFALIVFNDGIDKALIEKAQTSIKDSYIANLITTNAIYDPEQSKLAEKASFAVYDNALLLVIYDTEGNTGIIDTVNGK